MPVSKKDIEQILDNKLGEQKQYFDGKLEGQMEHNDDKFEIMAAEIAEVKEQTKDIPDMKRKLDIMVAWDRLV